MSHKKLIRVFLISTLVYTLPINSELKTLAQVETVQSLDVTQKEEKKQDYKKLLQKTNELNKEAEKFIQAVDQLSIEIQEKFNSKAKINKINLKPVLAQQKEFNKIWQEFDQELETKSELATFSKKKEIVKTIGSLEELLFALENSIKDSSSSKIAKLQEQIFTQEEIKRNFGEDRDFESKTLNKFSLVSKNKVRDLKLQVAQIEKHIYIQFLYLQQNVSSQMNSEIIELENLSSANLTKVNNYEQSPSLNILTLLNSLFLAVLSILLTWYFIQISKSVKKLSENSDNAANKVNSIETNLSKIIISINDIIFDTETINSTTLNYVEKKTLNSVRKRLKEINQTLGHIITAENFTKQQQFTKPSDNSFNKLFRLLNSIEEKLDYPKTQEFVNLLKHPEDIVDLVINYNHNAKSVTSNIYKVSATQESIKANRSGRISPIFFKELENNIYCIVKEPSLYDNCYFLVPKSNLKISESHYLTVKNMFRCVEYENRSSNNFKLIKPAIVKALPDNKWRLWQLIETGELKFETKIR